MTTLISIFRKIFSPRRSSSTVRVMFPVVLSSVALMSAAVLTSGDVSYVRLVPSTTTIEAGADFYIDVYAYAHVPVNAVDITVRFDSQAVDVVAVDTGQSVLTIWTEDPVINKNTVVLRGGTFRNGFLKEHLVARIDMRGKKTGLSTFKASDVILLAGDGAGSGVPVSNSQDSSISLYIYDENTNPDQIAVDVRIEIMTDIDNDGKVSLKDLSAFMSAWHSKSMVYDFNNDGRMSFRDFSIILSDFFFK